MTTTPNAGHGVPALSSPPVVQSSEQQGGSPPRRGVVGTVLKLKSDLTNLSQVTDKGSEFVNKVNDLISLGSSGDKPVSLTLKISSALNELGIPDDAQSGIITRILSLSSESNQRVSLPVQQVANLPEQQLQAVGQEMFGRIESVVQSGGPLHSVPCPKGLSVNDYGKLLKSLVDYSVVANRRARLLRMQVTAMRSKVKSLRTRVQPSQETGTSEPS